jgi:hypothetical protein
MRIYSRIVIPEAARRLTGIHAPQRGGYGFRVRAFGTFRNDNRALGQSA